MAASDLAVLTDVKAWLSGSSGIGTTDDTLLARLITDVSGAIAAYLGRPPLTPRAYAERLDGNGKARVYLRHYPVLQMTSLSIDNVAVPAAVTPARRRAFFEGLSARSVGRPAAGASAGARPVSRPFPTRPAECGDRLYGRLRGRSPKRHGSGLARPVYRDGRGAVRAVGRRPGRDI
jgi:hypothetical protein